MASITITIGLPIITAPEKFKVRYREYPSGSFGAYSDQDNDPFTISGIDAGQYELEVIYVTADGTECPAKYKLFNVAEDYECPEFNASIQQSGSTYYLNITYPVITNPSCGWEIQIVQGTTALTIPYNPLPPSPLNIPVKNQTLSLMVLANLCNNKFEFCFEDSIPAILPECDPIVINNVELIYNGPTSTLPNSWFIRLYVTGSNPVTPTMTASYTETSITAPLPPNTGTFSWVGSAQGAGSIMYSMQVFPKGIFRTIPNPNIDLPPIYIDNCISYTGVVVDICGISHPWSISGLWSPTQIQGVGTFTPNGC